jgi:aminoglycoside phosphotransferase (APT) family kinase protein
VKDGLEREVWDCRFTADGIDTSAVLTVFKPGDLQSVNTNLPPGEVARKCALAMSELPSLGIPTARVLGQSSDGAQSAVLCEKIEGATWGPGVRIEAARTLARLHGISEDSLSEALRHLAQISDPRESRTTGGQAPRPRLRTLVHGDYFSANILPVSDGLRIIDWETFGWGDPMWDLGFLVGADRDLPEDEVEVTISAYAENAQMDWDGLKWHRQHWSEFWQRRGS